MVAGRAKVHVLRSRSAQITDLCNMQAVHVYDAILAAAPLLVLDPADVAKLVNGLRSTENLRALFRYMYARDSVLMADSEQFIY